MGKHAHRASGIIRVVLYLMAHYTAGFAVTHNHHIDMGLPQLAKPCAFHCNQGIGEADDGSQNKLNRRANDIIGDRHTAGENQRACHLNHRGHKVCKEDTVQVVQARMLPAAVIEPERDKHAKTHQGIPRRKLVEIGQVFIRDGSELACCGEADNQCQIVGRVDSQPIENHQRQPLDHPAHDHAEFGRLLHLSHNVTSRKLVNSCHSSAHALIS